METTSASTTENILHIKLSAIGYSEKMNGITSCTRALKMEHLQ